MKYKLLILFVISISFGVSTTLEDAKTMILQKNQSITQIQNEIDISETNIDINQKWSNPTLSIGLNDISLNKPLNRSKEPMQTNAINISQKIPIGKKLSIIKQINSIQQKLKISKLQEAKLKLNEQITMYFYTYAILSEKLNLLEKYQKNIKNIKKILNSNYTTQNTSQIALINIDIMDAKLKIKKQKLIQKLSNTKAKISQLTYTDIEDISSPNMELALPNINTKRVLLKHPNIQMQNAKIQLAKENIKLQKSKKLDSIKLSMGYYNRDGFDDFVSLKASLSLPIYKTESNKIEKAKINLIKETNKLNQIKNDISSKIQIYSNNAKTAQNSYNILKKHIIKYQKLAQGVLIKFLQLKNTNLSDIINNLNDIIEQDLLALDELYRFYQAKTKLLYYQGQSL